MIEHTSESLENAAVCAMKAARIATEGLGVGLVVIVMDATQRIHYLTDVGPTLAAGMCARVPNLINSKG